jgi:DNA-binding winged helix-turn-helix (wHTH) protein
VIKDLCEKYSCVVGLNLFRNFGQINALMAGFNYVNGRYIVILDDDLQNPPEEIHKIIKALEGGRDFVFGVPEGRKDSLIKKLFSYLNDRTLYYFANKPRHIMLSSYLGMTRETVFQLRKYSGPFPYLAGLLFKITTNGETIRVKHNARLYGSSNYNLRRMLRLYLSGITNFSIIPLRISLFLGFLIAMGSFVVGLLLVMLKIFKFDFQIGSFHLNAKLRFLTFKNEEPIKLSPKENELLKMLALYENDLMPRELALTKIWRDDNYFTSRSMDVYIAKLRKYLKEDAKLEIVNIHGNGFRLVESE